ncbi:hypothetical protein BDZ94DRAFT_1271811 [Collybia nuda]|uniref:Uncharacterized protein n=1 Tax=Collybia nuda TaxID=64659 RepID=A0A9P5XUR6_9AGAR|nr:hypothetical protein BDZ94DRAFT_1271811 [Collybia nuda]
MYVVCSSMIYRSSFHLEAKRGRGRGRSTFKTRVFNPSLHPKQLPHDTSINISINLNHHSPT